MLVKKTWSGGLPGMQTVPNISRVTDSSVHGLPVHLGGVDAPHHTAPKTGPTTTFCSHY
jgi:hypothetical protein